MSQIDLFDNPPREEEDVPSRVAREAAEGKRRSAVQWAAIALTMLAILIGGAYVTMKLADLEQENSSRAEANARQDTELVKSAGAVSGLSNDVIALREALAKRGVNPDTIAPLPQERVEEPSMPSSPRPSVDEITAYVTTMLAKNRPKDGRTPTTAEVRAVVNAALTQTCGATCKGADGQPGSAGAPGSPGEDAPPPMSVTSVTIDSDYHLLLTLSNGSDTQQIDAGALPTGPRGPQGEPGAPGVDGQAPVQWVTRNEDGTVETCKRDSPFDPNSPTYTCTVEGPAPSTPDPTPTATPTPSEGLPALRR